MSSPGRPPSSSSSPPASMSSAAMMMNPHQAAEDVLFAHLAEDLTFLHDRKQETEKSLMEEVMTALHKEEKVLDADAWMYSALRSQLNFVKGAQFNSKIYW